MSVLDPIPHQRISQKLPSSKVGCRVCKASFAGQRREYFLDSLVGRKRLRRAATTSWIARILNMRVRPLTFRYAISSHLRIRGALNQKLTNGTQH